MLWIALEWYIWGFVALSNIFFVLGIVEVVSAQNQSGTAVAKAPTDPPTTTIKG